MRRTSNRSRSTGNRNPGSHTLRRSALTGILAAAILSAFAGRASAQVWNSVAQQFFNSGGLTSTCSHYATGTVNLATGAPSYTCIAIGLLFNTNGTTAGNVSFGETMDNPPSCANTLPAPASTTIQTVDDVLFTNVTPGSHTFSFDAEASQASAGSAGNITVLCVPQR